jgi:hypothetical protein
MGLEVDSAEIIEMRGLARQPISTDLPVGDNGDATFGDLVSDEYAAESPYDGVVYKQMLEGLKRALAALPERWAEVCSCAMSRGSHRIQSLSGSMCRNRVSAIFCQMQRRALGQLRRGCGTISISRRAYCPYE